MPVVFGWFTTNGPAEATVVIETVSSSLHPPPTSLSRTKHLNDIVRATEGKTS